MTQVLVHHHAPPRAPIDEPVFVPGTSRYGTATIWGRARGFFEAFDPRHALYSARELRRMQRALRAGSATAEYSNAALWRMDAAVRGSVHPTTNDVIPRPFRFGTSQGVNVLIALAMLSPATVASPLRNALVHTGNETYASLVNYHNRSGDAQSSATIARAYAAALAVALAGSAATSAAMRAVTARGGSSTAAATVVRATLPYLSVSCASCANLAVMRYPEWAGPGVPVKDEDGTVRGTSRIAGRSALAQCSGVRFLWNVPIMFAPPLLTLALMRAPAYAAAPAILRRAVEGTVSVVGLLAGVPLACAAFPLEGRCNALNLEAEFTTLHRSNGQRVAELSYYKGI